MRMVGFDYHTTATRTDPIGAVIGGINKLLPDIAELNFFAF